MTQFKVGDKVKRIAGQYHGMKAGDIGTVVDVDNLGIKLKEFYQCAGYHDGKMFELVDPNKFDDVVNHPTHYTAHPSGVECITVTEHMGFNLGNAVKYIWRADLKNDAIEDLKKAAWYINREIEKRTKNG